MSIQADITAGFLPLVDAAILIAAVENGHAAEAGLTLRLARETSWANIRDRLAVGHFEAAHCLAPMAIAANLGLTPFEQKMVVPMSLGLGGNAITVSNGTWAALGAQETADSGLDPADAGARLRTVIERRKDTGEPLLRIGVVHPHSSHNLELRYWLSACGISPDVDIETVILPPALMPDALSAGRLDGYCVGEPWNTAAVRGGIGRILTTKNAIWASSPEKALALPAFVAKREPDMVSALVRALHASAKWCSSPGNRPELARMLAAPDYLDADRNLVSAALGGAAEYEPYERAATFPWQSHALWFYSQLVRAGFVAHSGTAAETARTTFRPDLYRTALRATDAAIPSANAKVEGALAAATPVGAGERKLVLGPDGFFDGEVFDPDRIDDYIRRQSES